tara:strand:+ start:2611 stop:2856 length:246 start_codon:yes stop_codon:yes gene_type:complete
MYVCAEIIFAGFNSNNNSFTFLRYGTFNISIKKYKVKVTKMKKEKKLTEIYKKLFFLLKRYGFKENNNKIKYITNKPPFIK